MAILLDRLPLGRDLDVLALRPALGERAVERRHRVARLAGGLHEERALQIGEVIDGAQARAVPVGERRFLAELRLAAVQRVGAAGARHLDIEVGRQRSARRRTAGARPARSAPRPTATCCDPCRSASPDRPAPPQGRAPGCRRTSRAPASCGRRTSRAPSCAPPAGGSWPWRACRRSVEGRPQIVAVDGPHGLAQPGREDQRLGGIAAHHRIPGGELVEHGVVDAAARLRRHDHQRAQTRSGGRVDVVLRRAHAAEVMVAALQDQLADALLAERRVPIVGQEDADSRRHNARIGGAHRALGGIHEARQLLELQVALPVVGGVPARHRHASGDLVGRIAHRHAARRDQADVAGRIGDHHALHRHDVLAHALDVVGNAVRTCRRACQQQWSCRRRSARSTAAPPRSRRRACPRGCGRSPAARAHAACAAAPRCVRRRP